MLSNSDMLVIFLEAPTVGHLSREVDGSDLDIVAVLELGSNQQREKSAIGLQQELANEREKRQNIEMKLKEVKAQLQEERNIRKEMEAHIEESQRQFEERMDKQLEERLAAVFARTQTSFLVGQSSSAMNMASDSDQRVETTNTLIACK
ncbi:hypothetical protein SESBI_08067 [Sesbania bispinosa]|nr:hypothetical protein SESBI_08067 [Sesbania bispinosa]